MPAIHCLLILHFFKRKRSNDNFSYCIMQGSETYRSWARCGSFDDGIWLLDIFLTRLLRMKRFL